MNLNIEGLALPESCVLKAATSADSNDLFPEEQEMVSHYAEGPFEQFCMGRKAAHQALEGFVGSQAILRGERGQPIWPENMLGSISHTPGIALAVVAARKNISVLGIDVEQRDRSFNVEIYKKVCREEERPWLGENEERRMSVLRCLSAKEAVFKAFYPVENIYLGFLDACLQPCEGGFVGRLEKSAGQPYPIGTTFKVRQMLSDDYLISAICLAVES